MVIIDKLSTNYIDTIIFDIDSTITRWKNIENFLRKSLNILGVPYRDEMLIGLFQAMKQREYHAIITGEANEEIYSMLLEMYIKDLTKYGVSGENLKNVMFELEDSETFISEEVPEEIKKLSQNYNLYCYTNWFYNQAIKKLDRYDLTKYFKNIHSSEDNYIKFTKTGFLWLLHKYNLDPKKTIAIGDSKTDILPSNKANIQTIYLDYSLTASTKNIDIIDVADASITEFKDIRRVLKK